MSVQLPARVVVPVTAACSTACAAQVVAALLPLAPPPRNTAGPTEQANVGGKGDVDHCRPPLLLLLGIELPGSCLCLSG